MNPNLTPAQLATLQSYIDAAPAAYSGNYTGSNGVSEILAAYYSLQARAGRGYATTALASLGG
jgi:hypothetical protein